MPRHPLRRLAPTVATALALEAVAPYLGCGSALWRALLFPAHFLIGGWVLHELGAATRTRGTGRERRRGDRRRLERRQAPEG